MLISIKNAIHSCMSSDYRESIFRRSFILLFITTPALFFNFFYFIFANHILGITLFGILYASITAINILIGPAQILNLYLIRRVANAVATYSISSAWLEYRKYLKHIALLGIPISIVLFFIGLVGVSFLKFESNMLLFCIIICAYCLYLNESIRGTLQGIQSFSAIGLFLICYLGLRFILSLAFFINTEIVWPGILGIAMAGILTLIIFDRYIFWKTCQLKIPKPSKIPKSGIKENIRILFFFGTTMVFVSVLMYADNFILYLFFSKHLVGVYSRAWIWPKTLYVITLPVLQVFFPVLIDQISRKTPKSFGPEFLIKSLLMTLMISGSLSILLLIIPVNLIQIIMGNHDLINTEMKIIRILPLAVTPLCLIRVIVFDQLARGKYVAPFLLMPACVLQFLILTIFSNHFLQIPLYFFIINSVILIIFCLFAFRGLSITKIINFRFER